MQHQHNLCYCSLQEEENGPWIDGLAFLSAPGACDLIKFVPHDAAGAMRELKCWDYRLKPHLFAATVVFEGEQQCSTP